jgi:hypothetical protein
MHRGLAPKVSDRATLRRLRYPGGQGRQVETCIEKHVLGVQINFLLLV